MAHLRERARYGRLEIGLRERVERQRYGDPGKGASETALGGDDRFIRWRQLKCFDVDEVVHLTDHHAGVLCPNMDEHGTA